MPLRPNLMFAGNAETALTHYCAALGGDIEIIRSAGSPAADHVSAVWSTKSTIMDAPPGREGSPGDNFAIAVDIDDEGCAADVFAKLAADGGLDAVRNDILRPQVRHGERQVRGQVVGQRSAGGRLIR